MRASLCPTARGVRAISLSTILMIILASVLIASACASSGYPAASAQYDAESRAYQTAFDSLSRAKAEGRMTHEQDVRAASIAAEVRAADEPVFAALQAWKIGGVKPPSYDDDAKVLRDAQAKLIALAAEVH